MKSIAIILIMFIFNFFACVNAEIKEGGKEAKYILNLVTESKDLVLTVLPGDNIKFSLEVQGVAPLKNMIFYAGDKFFDITGIQNKTPPYKIDISNFTIDQNSKEETILCKVVGETNNGMFLTSNVVVVKVLDMNPPQIVKFEKDQTPFDSIISDSQFSVIVEVQDLNTGVKKIELYDANNFITTGYSETFSEKYVSRRYNFIAPRMNCGIVQLVLRVYDNSSQENMVEKRLILKINGHPFDESAPAVSFLSPEQNAGVSIGENIIIKVRAEDDCSLVDKIYYYTSLDDQVYTIDIINKKRIVEEDIQYLVPVSLNDGDEFSIFVWADDTNNPKHGSSDNAVELKLIASGNDIPTVSILSPQDNANISAGDILKINGTAISNRYQIKEVDLRFQGSYSEIRTNLINPPQATVQFSYDFNVPSTLNDGDQILIYVDAKDNSTSETVGTAGPVRINIVSQKPVIQILSPSANDLFYPLGTINTSVFAQSSNTAITKVSYHIEGIEGVSVDETYTPPTSQKTVSTTFLYKLAEDIPEGDLYITAEAEDKNGNKGSTQPVNIKVVDNVKPLVTVLSPPNNSFVDAGSSVDLVVKAEDKNSQIYEIDANVVSPYSDSKKLLINKKSDEVTFTFNIPDTVVSNQIITIQIFAYDDSSLSNKSDVIQWRLRVR